MHKEDNIIPQTREGALKAKETIRKKYGEDYYATIGRKGGQTSTTGGFYANRELARIAGRKGGLASPKDKNESSATSDIN